MKRSIGNDICEVNGRQGMFNKENGMDTDKKVIVDLVNKIKYEVSEEQLAELSGCATPLCAGEFVDWHARIDDLDLNEKCPPRFGGTVAGRLRELLHDIVGLVRETAGRMVPVGKRVVKWILSLVKRYPNTSRVAIVMAALCFVIAHVPILGWMLMPLIEAVAAGSVLLTFVLECCGERSAVGFTGKR